MTDDNERSPWAPPGEGAPEQRPTGAPGSSLPPPPNPLASSTPPPPPAPPAPPAPPGDVTMIEPIEPDPPSGGRWLGRGLAAAGAAVIIGGGGYLALNAGSDTGGADSPEAAVQGLFDALSAEDLVGVAELVEPTERETIVDAGFDVIDELVRLEVLADDFDVSAIGGIDFEFRDLDLRTERVGADVANVVVESGVFDGTYDADELPLGPLVLDRVSEDWLASSDTTSDADPGDLMLTTVERDGRWYLSLWYSVAENAREALDAPFPDADDRLTPLGAETPEDAVRRLVDEAEDLDVRQIIRMLDPEEAAALYEYAPLFLDDAERAVSEVLQEAGENGFSWEVHTLDLHADTSGDRATVVVDGIGFRMTGDGFSMELDATADSMVADIIGTSSDWAEPGASPTESTWQQQIVVEGDCTTWTYEDEYDSQTEDFCLDEVFDEVGLSSALLGGASGVLNPTTGIETSRVDGRWYISPTRTVTEPLLGFMRSWSAEDLESTVDAIIDFAEDPFGDDDFYFSTVDEPIELFDIDPVDPVDPSLYPPSTTVFPVPTTTFGPNDLPEIDPFDVDALNLDLIAPSIEADFSYDLDDASVVAEYDSWIPDVAPPPIGRGVYAETWVDAGGTVVVIVVDSLDAAVVAEHLVEIVALDGAIARDVAGYAVIETQDWFGDPVLVSASGTEIVVIGTYGAELPDMEAVLARQLAG